MNEKKINIINGKVHIYQDFIEIYFNDTINGIDPEINIYYFEDEKNKDEVEAFYNFYLKSGASKGAENINDWLDKINEQTRTYSINEYSGCSLQIVKVKIMNGLEKDQELFWKWYLNQNNILINLNPETK